VTSPCRLLDGRLALGRDGIVLRENFKWHHTQNFGYGRHFLAGPTS
jgi:hypothetical protein